MRPKRIPAFLYNPSVWLYLILILFGALFMVMSIANHYFFRTTAFDYGLYNFAWRDYAHFHISPCPIYHVVQGQSPTLMQDHLSLILFLLVPFYWLFNWLTGSYTLLLVQTLMILWSGWAIYKLIKLKSGDVWLGLGALLYYFLLSGRYSAFQADFNLAIFCVCFVPIFLYYFEARRFGLACLFFVLSLFSREDMPLWFLFIFIVLIIWHWKERRTVQMCLWYMTGCVVYFIVLFKVLIPFFETPDHPYAIFNYGALGKNPLEAIQFIFRHPIDTIILFFRNHSGDPHFDWVKTEFYLVYLISGGLLLLVRPYYFIWFIPVMAQKMLNDDFIRWSFMGSYSAQVITLLPISVFMVVSVIRSKRWRYISSVALCVMAWTVTAFMMEHSNRVLKWSSTLKENIFDPHFFDTSFDPGKIHKLLRSVPSGAKVSASASLIPHLAQRQTIYHFPDVGDAEYLAVFSTPDYYLMSKGLYNAEVYKYVFRSDWNLIGSEESFFLFKREPNHLKNYLPTDSIACEVEKQAPGDKDFIATDGQLVENTIGRDSTRSHSGKYSIKLSKGSKNGMVFKDGNIQTGDLIRVSVWRYSEDGKSGTLVIYYDKNRDLYLCSANGQNKDSRGWEELVIFMMVPAEHRDFKIYVMPEGGGTAWFDDLKIVRYRR